MRVVRISCGRSPAARHERPAKRDSARRERPARPPVFADVWLARQQAVSGLIGCGWRRERTPWRRSPGHGQLQERERAYP